ncbi:MAG: imidazolonepropionase [Acidobacteria bacterium]|nr:imidazolonepropionase [Acidobacteriota bacterium]
MPKSKATLVVRGIGQCLTMGQGTEAAAGTGQEDVGLIEDAAIAAADGRIVYAGPASGLLREVREAADVVRVDARDGVVLPGFVDPHTHLLFGGWRSAEFGQRVAGDSYQEILAAGGGILSTVAATRELGEEELVDLGRHRLGLMLSHGTTTVEAKSGYGLSLEHESRLVRAARRLAATETVDVVTTLLGAHAVPPEFRGHRDQYVGLVIEMVRALADRIDFVDAFCEEGAFSVAECRQVFAVARDIGLGIKLHADQLGTNGGAELAAEFGAVSADHLDYISATGTAALAESGTVAVLLPTVPMYVMNAHQAPAKAIQKAGVPIALATDFNPGTSPVMSMGVVIATACMLLRMSPEAALVAATRNAAAAIGRSGEIGTLQVGMAADLQVYSVDDYRMLPYRFGELKPDLVVKQGALAHSNDSSFG